MARRIRVSVRLVAATALALTLSLSAALPVGAGEFNNPGGIGRITTSGEITELTTGLSPNSGPLGIAAGCDGNLWFTESADPGRIGRITPSGVITEFTAGLSPDSEPVGIAAGPTTTCGSPSRPTRDGSVRSAPAVCPRRYGPHRYRSRPSPASRAELRHAGWWCGGPPLTGVSDA
jgi:hypothetical protein